MSTSPTAGFPAAVVDALAAWIVDQLPDETALPALFGVSGLQGSGKTTLVRQLAATLSDRGIGTLPLSLDDVYRTRAERLALARDVHPLFATRGVPGTHDLALLDATLDALPQASPATPVAVPRFDKGIDDRVPRPAWPRVGRMPRLVLLEGWCIGVPAQSDELLRMPVNALERDEDADGRWRRHVNGALAGDYARLWARLDRLIVLLAPSFEIVRVWRDEQERLLRALGAARALSAEALQRFVAHYERLSRHALTTLPARADRVLRLDAGRRVVMDGRAV